MKKFFVILLSVIFTVVSCIGLNIFLSHPIDSASNNYHNQKTIVIDAGHGGRDVGAVGFDNSLEKNINLDIALMLYDFFMVSGVNCVMTRSGDYATYKSGDNRNRSDLYNRLDIVDSIDNSILISIHQNHFDDSAENGTQIWYSANTAQSKVLADSILSTVKMFIQPDNSRQNKESDSSYYLLYRAKAPSIMVECGFVSNEEENKRLQDKEYQGDIAYSIMVGASGEI